MDNRQDTEELVERIGSDINGICDWAIRRGLEKSYKPYLGRMLERVWHAGYQTGLRHE